MARVITFSRVFPSYHPKKGQPTHFIEKIVKSLHWDRPHPPVDIRADFDSDIYLNVNPKQHTIRAGHRWKVGDIFSPRVWIGKPYASKQIQFAPDIEIKKVWNFDVDPWESYVIDGKPLCYSEFKSVAINDGFNEGDDLECWLNVKPKDVFNGQIICWNENINY